MIRVPKRYSAIFDELEKNDYTLFKSSNCGDLSVLRKVERSSNSKYGKEIMNVLYDRKKKCAIILSKKRMRRHHKNANHVFFDLC